MTLTPGTRVGPYEIAGRIGAGGMGEVYRAVDTRLDRAVAIKTLAGALAGDADRLARFEREAKLLATLNHAHIGAVYGLDEHDGMRFIAMELVDGETLEKRLERGALPVEDALRIALQIAEALEAAHAKGVVHRDLKPANVMVADDGQVKVLDFGLAKAFAGDPGEAVAAHSPALSLAMTQAGLVLGTAGYMSPEQASGQGTDQRADVWAFGVVLYEMLTGLPLFAGESVPHILADVLRAEPDWSRLPRNLHPRVRQLLERCLTKRVRDRYHSIADARVDIEHALNDPRGATPPPADAPRASRRLLPLAAALLAGAALAGVAAFVLGPAPPAPALQRVSIMVPPERPATVFGWPTRMMGLSSDGRLVAYRTFDPAGAGPLRSRARLALRTLDALAVRDIPGSEDGVQPFFSPDGGWVAFFTGSGQIRKVSLAGGGAITLAEDINGAAWGFGVWTRDGTIVFGTLTSGLRRLSAEGGEIEDLTTLDAARGERFHLMPALVPGRDVVLFTVTTTSARSRIEAVELSSGQRRIVVDDARAPHVADSGHLLFQRGEAVLVAPFDVGALALTGSAVPLPDAIQHDNPSVLSVAQLALSDSGTLAYVPAVAAAETLGLVRRDGAFEALAVPTGNFQLPRMSPDGRAVAFLETRGQQTELWVHDLARGTRTRVGASGRNFGLAWHPSGRSLAVAYAPDEGPPAVFLVGLDGSERLLVEPAVEDALLRNLAWSPDGVHLAYTVQTGSLHDIWVYSLDDGTAAPFQAGAAIEHSPRFSPDGRWLAFESDESGELQVYVRGFPAGPRLQVSIDDGRGPLWAADGTELYYVGTAGSAMRVNAVTVTPDGDSLRLGTPAALFELAEPGAAGPSIQYEIGSNLGPSFDVLPDGGGFVAIRVQDTTLRREIVLVQNVHDELQRLAPARR